MTDRDLLIELLAIKFYELECDVQMIGRLWFVLADVDRQVYRNLVSKAANSQALYED
jgi:hypothetical protein